MTDRLVELGLIHRERSEQDRRAVHISISEKGKLLLQQIRQAMRDHISYKFHDATVTQLKLMVDVFDWINASMASELDERNENNGNKVNKENKEKKDNGEI